MYELLVFLHIVAAAVWLGVSVTQRVLFPRFASDDSAMATFLRTTVTLGRMVTTPAAILILATGLALVPMNDAYAYEQAFIAIGLAVVVAGAALGMAVFGPRGRRAAELREAGDRSGAAAVERSLIAFGGLELVLVLVAFAAMVWKLGA